MTVAVYVPDGVPFAPAVDADPDPPPPQPAIISRANTSIGACTRRDLLARRSRHEPLKAKAHTVNQSDGGKLPDGRPPPVIRAIAAVVVTVAVTAIAELPDTLTEAGTLQIGAGVAVGVTLQVKVTVPLNDPSGVSARPNVAVPPAEMVDELELPDAMPKVKSGAAKPVPFKLMDCGELNALSVT